MVTKCCSKCRLEKDIEGFQNQKSAKDGKGSYCKECRKVASKEYIQRNRILNKEKTDVQIRTLRPEQKCFKCKQIRSSQHFVIDKTKRSGLSTVCTDCSKGFRKAFYERNPGYIETYNKKYYTEHVERIKKVNKEYLENNKEKMRERSRTYERNKFKTDINWKLRRYLRDNVRQAVKKNGIRKNSKTLTLLGCSIEEFKHWIESLFTEGMDWDNYGKWELDHKRPCASFNLTNIEEQKQCFHYTNYQPLWELDNIKKSSYYKGQKHEYKNKVNKKTK